MHIAIFGAGGVGGYFGGRLADAGVRVSLVARGAHLEAIRARGLRIRSPLGDATVKPHDATDDPAEIGQVDAVIVATKTFQLDDAVAALPPLLRDDTLVVPLLNGVEAPARLRGGLERGEILGGLCRIISYVEEPGLIAHVGAEPYVAFGPLDGEAPADVHKLRLAFAEAGVSAEVPQDVRAAMWKKFLMVASWGALGALTRAPIGPIREQPETRALLQDAMEEVLAVANARGVALGRSALGDAIRFFDALPYDGTTSLQRDLAEGRPSELDAWSGSVVRLAGSEVQTPVHQVAYGAMLPTERRARGEIQF